MWNLTIDAVLEAYRDVGSRPMPIRSDFPYPETYEFTYNLISGKIGLLLSDIYVEPPRPASSGIAPEQAFASSTPRRMSGGSGSDAVSPSSPPRPRRISDEVDPDVALTSSIEVPNSTLVEYNNFLDMSRVGPIVDAYLNDHPGGIMDDSKMFKPFVPKEPCDDKTAAFIEQLHIPLLNDEPNMLLHRLGKNSFVDSDLLEQIFTNSHQ